MASSDKDFEVFNSKLFSFISKQNGGKNVFFSPTSIALALSACTLGARDETLNQMLSVFGVPNKGDLRSIVGQVTQLFKRVHQDSPLQQTSTDNTPSKSSSSTPLDLRIINRMYAHKTFNIEAKYLDRIRRNFLSDVIPVDFIVETNQAIDDINKWVEDQTSKRICNVVSNTDITPGTTFVIINCIYFKGEWQSKFQEKSTDKNADFHNANGDISKIELMFHKEFHNYIDDPNLGVQVAHLLYKSAAQGCQFAFTIILPKEGVQLDEIEQKLMSNLELKQKMLNIRNAESKELLLYLPKFKIQAKYNVTDTMIALGMEDAFDNTKANFKGIIGHVSDENRVWIGTVLHKTFVDVNEDGTEAAASGVVIMERFGSSLANPTAPIEFKANRPFLFFIQDVESSIIIFTGKFVSPEIA